MIYFFLEVKMENQINEGSQNTQQIGQSPVSQPVSMSEKPKVNYWMISTVVLVLLAVGFTGGYFFKSISEKRQSYVPQPTPNNYSDIQPTTKPTITEQPTTTNSNWKTYSLKTIGLEFKLPPIFNSYGEMKEEIKPGEKGTQLCMTFAKKTSFLLVKPAFAGGSFCDINYFGFGTVSLDYEAGRGGGFTDLLGFAIEDGKYYARQNLNRKFEIPANLVREVSSQDGVKVLKIIGKYSTTGEWQGPIAGTPGDGRIGALVNTTNTLYPGIAIEMELSGSLTEEVFDQVLSSQGKEQSFGLSSPLPSTRIYC
ncbi:MAG: hypothetical protein US39_C0016G0046 [Microgenomates group bacterium GW2011_GWC1_37_12b]|nr:MAG: hypothetical protein US39_C0016G0046 [Microgenomates group bacterium GW2011_GWC1_37_12b]